MGEGRRAARLCGVCQGDCREEPLRLRWLPQVARRYPLHASVASSTSLRYLCGSMWCIQIIFPRTRRENSTHAIDGPRQSGSWTVLDVARDTSFDRMLDFRGVRCDAMRCSSKALSNVLPSVPRCPSRQSAERLQCTAQQICARSMEATHALGVSCAMYHFSSIVAVRPPFPA